MNRDEMIAILVGEALERVIAGRQVFWLQGILENGFRGFAQRSDDELRRELRDLGLDGATGPDHRSDPLHGLVPDLAGDEPPEYLLDSLGVRSGPLSDRD